MNKQFDNGGAQRYRRREVERCACGDTIYMEQILRGKHAGTLRPLTENGLLHRCKMPKV